MLNRFAKPTRNLTATLIIREDLTNIVAVMKHSLAPLIVLHLAETMTHDALNSFTSIIHRRGREDILGMVVVVALELIAEMIFSSLWLLLIVEAITKREESDTQSQLNRFGRLNQLMIEYVRSLSAILIRLPVFVVPAVIEYLRLQFVPLIVLLDSEYASGSCDALKQSRARSKGHLFVIGLVAVVSSVIGVVFEDFGRTADHPWLWQNPLEGLIGLAISFATSVVAAVFLVTYFQSIAKDIEKTTEACA